MFTDTPERGGGYQGHRERSTVGSKTTYCMSCLTIWHFLVNPIRFTCARRLDRPLSRNRCPRLQRCHFAEATAALSPTAELAEGCPASADLIPAFVQSVEPTDAVLCAEIFTSDRSRIRSRRQYELPFPAAFDFPVEASNLSFPAATRHRPYPSASTYARVME